MTHRQSFIELVATELHKRNSSLSSSEIFDVCDDVARQHFAWAGRYWYDNELTARQEARLRADILRRYHHVAQWPAILRDLV